MTNMNKNNTGENNSGHRNSGDWNSGDWNSGDWNSGHRNSGHRNSGYRNSGHWNSGHRNSGHWNSGHRNSGHRNSGDWNSGDWNTGFFNTGTPDKIQVFNQWVDMTHDEFMGKYNIYADIPLNRWIDEDDMTKEELKEFPEAKQMGGYLKTLDFKEACQIWWKENPERHKDFLELPNFDSSIFKEITGIDIEDTETIEIAGHKYSKNEVEEALKNIKEIK